MISKRQILFIAADHAGVQLKGEIITAFSNSDLYTLVDLGCENNGQSVDYPDYAAKLVARIKDTPESLGVLICGTGIGMSIAANRHKGIRAALVCNEATAKLARQHNDANVLCFGARFTDLQKVKLMLDAWLGACFDGDRHVHRLKKLDL